MRLAVGVTVRETEFGPITIYGGEKGINRIDFGTSSQNPNSGPEPAYDFDAAVDALTTFIVQPNSDLPDIPIEYQGTDFQISVWKEIQQVPYGCMSTYKQLALNVGRPKAFQAIAKACSQNPLAYIIPCHRIISSTGLLSGFKWGTALKQKLLQREGCYGTY